MQVKFLDELLVRVVDDDWNELIAPFRILVKEAGQPDYIVDSPAGFMTNFASVPRVLVAYEKFGGRGKKGATGHDRLYFTCERPREWCDAFLHHALLATPGFTPEDAEAMYMAVRLFGNRFYGGDVYASKVALATGLVTSAG